MSVRVGIVLAVVLATGPAVAEQMNADAARRFVVGNLFAFNCFEGTHGAGRVYSDGSVAGNIQIRGNGPPRWVTLPAGTLRVRGEAVCAAVRGVPFEPCFNLDRTDTQSFRGSIAGLGFAYCDFTRRSTRPNIPRTTERVRGPLSIHAAAIAPQPEDASVRVISRQEAGIRGSLPPDY
jgi:hypothetical protein